jgi:hypothetical protein
MPWSPFSSLPPEVDMPAPLLKKRTFPSNEAPEPGGPVINLPTTFSISIPKLALIRDLRNGGASMRAINPMFIRAITG